MSHIDEGTLHAYLDGALDLYPEAEARQVRRHLESCAECKERLEEERAVREEAEAILSLAAPDVSAPPLEELRAEAARRGTPGQRRGLSRVNRWAWAASVVLALGTGWMLRGRIGAWVSQPAPMEEAAEPSVVEPAPADVSVQPTLPLVDAASQEERSGTEDPVEDPVADRSASREEEAAPSGGAGGAGAADTDAGAPAPPPAEPEAGVSEADAVKTAPAAADSGAGLVRPTGAPLDAPSAREPVEQTRSDAELAPQMRFRVLPNLPQGRIAEDARYAVPGLMVLESVRLGEGDDPPVPGAVRVRQLTESGDTLVLIHLPPGVEPTAVGARLAEADDLNEAVVLVDGVWTLLRGPFSEESLLAYGERLRIGG